MKKAQIKLNCEAWEARNMVTYLGMISSTFEFLGGTGMSLLAALWDEYQHGQDRYIAR